MALQNSGTITLDQVGKEFRGPKPYDLDSHRRGGGKVPANVPGNMNPPLGGNPTRDGFIPTSRCDASGPWVPDGNCPEQFGPCSTGSPTSNRTFICPNNIVTVIAPCGVSGPGSICGEKWVSMTDYNTNFVPGVPATSYGAIMAHQVQVATTPNPDPNPPVPNPPNPVIPGFMNPPIPINTGVPTSGTIKLDDFYGARR